MAPDIEDEILNEKNPRPLDEDDIALLKTYGLGPYSTSIKQTEKEIKEKAKKINDLCEFWICLLLTILGYVPGMIYAVWVIVQVSSDSESRDIYEPLA